MMAIRSLRDQPVIDEIVLKPTVITKDNYQPFDMALEQRNCPTFEEVAKLGAK
jgi:ribose transport system substrate-binding protein